ncbi:MAG: NUDIX domain-containing protein [Symploca sp. SIO2B6]|nr:NUDIX domain-containing protein [Symploca sp. SIO2B6]
MNPSELPNIAKPEVPHFEESGRMNKDGLLPAEIYRLALDYLVITCVDIVFLYQNQILLGKRNQYPRKGWWVIGGRMFAGESPKFSVQRKARQEAGLNLDAERFEYINAYSTCFSLRSQEPQEHGLHSVNLTYKTKLTQTEKNKLQLVHSEYEQWQWFELNAVSKLLDSNNELDRALLRIVQDIQLSKQFLRRLDEPNSSVD